MDIEIHITALGESFNINSGFTTQELPLLENGQHTFKTKDVEKQNNGNVHFSPSA